MPSASLKVGSPTEVSPDSRRALSRCFHSDFLDIDLEITTRELAMTRAELISRDFNQKMQLLEIGASYNPILPKADGWQTTIVDHGTQEDLKAKYRPLVPNTDGIEFVDYVWQDGSLANLIPATLHATFDGLVASHVGEHFPDFIAFMQSASMLVKSTGVLALALPDRRVCFDFFQPLTTTGALIEAHREQRTRHKRATFFNQAAYHATRDGVGGWLHGETAPLQLSNTLEYAQNCFDSADESAASDYRDSHAWVFTPKSFELLMLELNLLGYTDWAIKAIEPAAGVEFYVWLERKRLVMPAVSVNPLRLSLLLDMTQDMKAAAACATESRPFSTPAVLDPAPPAPALPSIAVVVALYNGSRYIEQTLLSVFRQTLPPAEVIVVDDGSTDDGAGVAIVERLALTVPIQLLRKPNGGQSSARNLGVRGTHCELIALLDQDDIWYENHLHELVKPFCTPSEPPLGWVYSDLDEIDENGFLVCRSYLSTLPTVHPKRHIFECIGQDMFILPSASLISRAAFEAVGGFDERLCGYEDDDLFIRLFRAGYHNIYLKQALSMWRIYTGSTSYSYRMAISRNHYTRKLIAMFPNDVRRSRFYVRDLIVPRFFEHAISEYEAAVNKGDPLTIEAAWGEVRLLAEHNDGLGPRLIEHAVARYRAAWDSGDPGRTAAIWSEINHYTTVDRSMIPLLFEHTLADYKTALLRGDRARITAAWSRLAEVQPQARHSPRLQATLWLLRNPTVAKLAFVIHGWARPVMLWAFDVPEGMKTRPLA